jgi:tetratricopeptide (TPR) repeat protein
LELLDLRDRALVELALPVGHPSRLENTLLRADIKFTRRELGGAEKLAAEVRSLVESETAKRFEGAALFFLARVKHQDGALTTAMEHYVQAEAALRAAGPKHELAACLSEKASALLDLGKLDGAWDAFNEAQEIFEDTGRLLSWAQNQLGLARVALRQGDPDHANTLCRRARSFARREQLSLVEANASMVLAEIQMAEGVNEEASESLDRSIDLFEQLGLVRQEIYPRLLRILMLLESASVDRAKTELAQLWSGPDIDAPWIAKLLMSCIGLTLDVDEAPEDFSAAVAEVSEMIGETEVVPPDIARCLQLATERALETGYPERAAQIRTLGSTATA